MTIYVIWSYCDFNFMIIYVFFCIDLKELSQYIQFWLAHFLEEDFFDDPEVIIKMVFFFACNTERIM